MQSETSEVTSESLENPHSHPEHVDTQYGFHRDDNLNGRSLSQREEQRNHDASGSEWSHSPSSGTSPIQSVESEIDFAETASSRNRYFLGEESTDTNISTTSPIRPRASGKARTAHGGRFPLQAFPEELLFHVISHLPASDLLSVKLVSRRFHDIVASPHAWINAFSKYFPGPDALARTADISVLDAGEIALRSESRSFTRLHTVTSWTSEYLTRTKLLRCLGRGKPAMPFAAPSPGRPNKGYATFTYSSRLNFGISHLYAKFGPILDKRLPHFVHGFSGNGTVSSSDKRGKLDGWGIVERGNFQTFSNLYPGTAQWGLGMGEFVGVPNIMDLSSNHGMVYGEGVPGGSIYYLANGEKHGRYVANLPDGNSSTLGVPKMSVELTTVCALWIAKTTAIPRLTSGLVGFLCGASDGTVSAFSLGTSSDSQHRRDRGELTARWVLSPGVPIVAIIADDDYSEERRDHKRVWAVAVNALGEVFSLSQIPEHHSAVQPNPDLELEQIRELQAWQTGGRASWKLVESSRREDKFTQQKLSRASSQYPTSVWNCESGDHHRSELSMTELNKLLSRRPLDIRADFNGWNMQRRMEVDFAGDDGRANGENVVVFDCGSDEQHSPGARRYTRCVSGHVSKINTNSGLISPITSEDPPELEVINEWHCSQLSFGHSKPAKVTVTTIDASQNAISTCFEDLKISNNRFRDTTKSNKSREQSASACVSPLKTPGQRARFIAAGTSTGKVFLWNIRAPPPGSVDVVNEIDPLRVIHTESPEITALALTALYLVHGGSEGLVQAWDPLASTLHPVRTISSRNTLNARRRTVIAAQQNPLIQAQIMVSNYAATAICLDPDPTVLRGIVAIGSHLRYWSYSSTAAPDELSKSQKRRLHRVAKGLSANSNSNYVGTRRVSLKGIVSQEVAEQALENKNKRAANKEQRRLAGRFGLDLLGHDASEEELIAYAKLLSQEQQEAGAIEAAQLRLGKYASFGEIEAFKSELTEEDLERWQYASWQERFSMPSSQSRTPTILPSLTPAMAEDSRADAGLEYAIRLSLEQDAINPSLDPQQAQMPSSPAPVEVRSASSCTFDADMAEAIRLSLAEAGSSYEMGHWEVPPATNSNQPLVDIDDDIVEAKRLSLQDQKPSASYDGCLSPRSHRAVALTADDHEFPPLTASPQSSGSPGPASGRQRGRRKGKEPVVWG